VGVVAVGAGGQPVPVTGAHLLAGVGPHGGVLGVGAVMALAAHGIDDTLIAGEVLPGVIRVGYRIVAGGADRRVLPPDRVTVAGSTGDIERLIVRGVNDRGLGLTAEHGEEDGDGYQDLFHGCLAVHFFASSQSFYGAMRVEGTEFGASHFFASPSNAYILKRCCSSFPGSSAQPGTITRWLVK